MAQNLNFDVILKTPDQKSSNGQNKRLYIQVYTRTCIMDILHVLGCDTNFERKVSE